MQVYSDTAAFCAYVRQSLISRKNVTQYRRCPLGGNRHKRVSLTCGDEQLVLSQKPPR